MPKLHFALITAFLLSLTAPAQAENRDYGDVSLTGLARESWPLNPGIQTSLAMVCNVNGPDGFLSIRGSASSLPTVTPTKMAARPRTSHCMSRAGRMTAICVISSTDQRAVATLVAGAGAASAISV